MIDKMYEKLIDPQAILTAMKETFRQIDPKYSEEEAAFLDGIQALRERLSSDHPVSLDAYLEEEERDIAECLLHLFWKGVKQNYDCFVNPVNKLFLQMDYEDIHQESVMRQFLPTQFDDLGTKFIRSLPAEMNDMTAPITSYYSYLQTVAYKLVHYYGFRFGDSFLSKVVPGYLPDCATTIIYGSMLQEDLNLKNLKGEAITSA